jgi:hypothetical protein
MKFPGVPDWYGQRVYCQFGGGKGRGLGGPFVCVQRIFGGGVFTFCSHLADSYSETSEINEFVRSVNQLGENVVGLTAWIFALAGIS